MTTEELHREMADGFKRVDERFVANDERFDAIDAKFDALRSDLEARIKEEGDTTRRHFDVMVEKMEAAVRIVAEGYVHLRAIGDDHEARLQAIEKRP